MTDLLLGGKAKLRKSLALEVECRPNSWLEMLRFDLSATLLTSFVLRQAIPLLLPGYLALYEPDSDDGPGTWAAPYSL